MAGAKFNRATGRWPVRCAVDRVGRGGLRLTLRAAAVRPSCGMLALSALVPLSFFWTVAAGDTPNGGSDLEPRCRPGRAQVAAGM